MRKINISGNNLKATINNVEYNWCGGFGCIIYSFERGLKLGDVRIIGDVLFYVYSIDRSNKVCWTIQNCDIENIRNIKAAIFSIEINT